MIATILVSVLLCIGAFFVGVALVAVWPITLFALLIYLLAYSPIGFMVN